MDNPLLDLDYWLSGRDPEAGDFADVISELWSSGLSLADRLPLAEAIIREHPSTLLFSNVVILLETESLAQYTDGKRSEASRSALEQILAFYAQALLAEDPQLAASAENSLYVDWFESPTLGPIAWRYLLASPQLSDALLGILLRNSGPLAWSLKYPILLRLADEKQHHLIVYQAIRHALFDPQGQADEQQASDLFAELDLEAQLHRIAEPPGYPTLAEVQERLAAAE